MIKSHHNIFMAILLSSLLISHAISSPVQSKLKNNKLRYVQDQAHLAKPLAHKILLQGDNEGAAAAVANNGSQNNGSQNCAANGSNKKSNKSGGSNSSSSSGPINSRSSDIFAPISGGVPECQVFHNTRQTIGSCKRHFQTITLTSTTIGVIECKHKSIDTTVNKELCWPIKKQKKVHKKVLKRIHTHINCLTSKHITYKMLTNTQKSIGSVTTEKVKVNYTTFTSASVATLTKSVTCKRVMHSKCVSVRTLTTTRVSFKRVKQAFESVSQSVQRTKKCASTHGGKGFGDLSGSKNNNSCGCGGNGQISGSIPA